MHHTATAPAAIPQRVAPFWSERYPQLGKGPIPLEQYLSPEHFELEKKYIFGRAWLHVGRVEQIANPGDFFTKDLDAPNATLIVVRGRDGKVRALHNVCAHRCNRVVHEASGCATRFSCRFHGWTFGLDGKLAGVPDRQRFHELKDENHGLSPVHCEIWQGFIFINLDPQPAETLTQFLGEHFRQLEGYPFEHLTSIFGYDLEVNCNWKVALDAFQEGYHVPFVHARSLGNKLTSPDNRMNQPLDVVLSGYHGRLSLQGNMTSLYGNPAAVADQSKASIIKPTKPIEEAAFRFGIPGMRQALEKLASKPLPEGMNPSKAPNWAFDINVMFPDFYLSMRPTYYMAYNFRPVAADKTRFEARVYYPKADKPSGRFYQEYMKVVLRDVASEDFATTEHVQRGMSTGAKTHMVLQENEILCRHHHEVCNAYIRTQRERDAARSGRG
jgi:phenylpropionate dioxygenase-like ring-hydroxylating dioxygenase large terminal subunit